MNANESYQPLAIVGLACRLPGGLSSPSQLWEALLSGKSGRGEVPKSRFNIDAFYHPDPQHPASINSPQGYFLDKDIREFDHEFFSINSMEARYMDPQQRQLLEVAFECIESAGISLDEISGRDVGCYIANFTSDFAVLQAKDPELYHRYSGTGLGTAILANRVSHCFNLKGPSVTMDTACSSSFFALHQACAALRAGECDAAFVGCANLIQSPEVYMGAVKAGLISGTAACHTFDISADGYARAEGVGFLYVKRLDDAIRANDPIRSIIRGTAANSNGRTNGISLPCASGQEAVIRKTYANSRLSPDSTQYIEAHGTGTEVGDGIEIDAFSRVLRHKSGNPIMIGSIKTNLGHSEAVSGISSIIKVTLALERGVIPQTIGVKTINPKLRLEERNATIVTENTPWPKGSVRRASLNSFGYGGSNGHLILENASAHVPLKSSLCSRLDLPCRVIPLSSRSREGLATRRAALSNIDGSVGLNDLAYTLSCRRSYFENRGFLIATDQEWRSDLLQAPLKTSVTPKRSTPVLYAFTGQGAQWAAMGAALINSCQVFADTIDSLDMHLSTIKNAPMWRLKNVLTRPDASAINEASVAQPACTALQIGLMALLQTLDILPDHVIGHSSGEIAAAYAAGYLTAEESIVISYYRGLAVSQKLPPGSMAVLGCNEETALSIINELGYTDHVEIACFNSPMNLTISGDPVPVDVIIRHAQAKQIFARGFNTGNKAYHSKHMALIGERYENLIAPILHSPSPESKYSSAMTSSLFASGMTCSDARDPKYWRQNLEKPVLFSQAISLALEEQEYYVIEIGPHSTFKIVMMDIAAGLSREVQYSPTVIRGLEPVMTIMQLTGSMFLHGLDAPIKKINGTSSPFASGTTPAVVTDLSPYPWKRGPVLWNEGRLSSEYLHRIFPRHDLLGSGVVGGSKNVHTWRNVLNLHHVLWLHDHKLKDTFVFPAAGYLVMIIEAFGQIMASRGIVLTSVALRDIKFLTMLTFDDEDTSIELFTELCPTQNSLVHPDEDKFCFTISSFASNTSTIHCRGIVEMGANARRSSTRWSHLNATTMIPKVDWYNTLRKEGLNFGDAFQLLDHIKHPTDHGAMEVLCTCNPPSYSPHTSLYPVHPAVIDSLFQASIISTTSGRCNALKGKIPVSIDTIEMTMDSPYVMGEVRARSSFGSQHTAICDAEMFDGGKPLISVKGLQIAPWIKYDLDNNVAPREPFLEKVWTPEIEITSGKTGLAINGVHSVGESNGINGVHAHQSGLIVLEKRHDMLPKDFQEGLGDRTGIDFTVAYLEDTGDLDIPSQGVVIVCLEVTRPLLSRVNDGDLEKLQKLFRTSSKVVWVHGTDSMGRGNPEFGLVSGLCRALTFEQPTLTLCTFDVGLTGLDHSTYANLSHIIKRTCAGQPDREYCQKDGILYVPKILPVPHMNAQFEDVDHGRTTISLEDAQKCHLSIKNAGSFQTLAFQSSTKLPELDADFVEVQVKAASINAKDYYALRGLVNTRDATCSLDFSGIITRVGAGVKDLICGDRVVGMAPNHLGSYIQVPQWACYKLEKEEDFLVMASVPVVFVTALYGLRDRAQLRAGETILIHSAAGSAGMAAIQVAKMSGARIFATVGTEAKKDFLISEFGLARENIFSSRNADFVQEILDATDGCGVDVCFSSLTGNLLHASWTVCADFGRFVDISKRDSLDGGRLDMRPFSRSVTYYAFDLSELFYSKNCKLNALWRKLLCESVDMIRAGAFRPIKPLRIFDVSQIAEAFTYFGSSTRIGKIVVSFEDPRSSIPYQPARYKTSFKSTKAYLLIGCLGGLGRTLSSWMVDQGARHLVFMGRSGATSLAAVEHIERLRARGVQVTVVKGDVSVFEDVKMTINAVKMPIGGVIQAAMHLDESLFDNMTAAQWHAGLAPKVRGAENLHRALANTPLDFFLMTSSVAGTVGLATETNYCAANAYLDALAYHRRQLGLPAISIALGCISDVGYLNERPDVEKMLLRKGITAYNPDEVVKIVDVALCFADRRQGHVITGLEEKGVHRLSKSGDLCGTIFDDVRLKDLTQKAKASFDQIETRTTARSSLKQDLDAAISAAVSRPGDSLQALYLSVNNAVYKILSGILLLESDRLEQNAQLTDLGMDSMLGAELRTALFKNLGYNIPLAVLLQEHIKLGELSEFIGNEMVKNYYKANGNMNSS